MVLVQQLPVGSKRLWFGVLMAPTAWLVAELVGYYLAARSCEPAIGGVPLEGTARPSLTQIILVIVALAAALAGLVVSLGSWRALHQHAGDAAPQWGRANFMAAVGVLASALFIGGIAFFGLPPFLLNVCSKVQ